LRLRECGSISEQIVDCVGCEKDEVFLSAHIPQVTPAGVISAEEDELAVAGGILAGAMSESPILSTQAEVTIIVPALNEANTIGEVVDRLLALPISAQIIVVNDGSTDATGEILNSYGDRITVLTNERPTGKGSAIRKAVPHATGQVTIIQDADLEYAPEQIPALIKPILDGEESVVYGSRFHHGLPKEMALPNKIVNVLLALSVRTLFRSPMTDEATCYKAFKTQILQGMELECIRFEFCPEVTAKALRMGYRIVERPIEYTPRSKAAGKKIRWTDAPEAFLTLFRYRRWSPKVTEKSE
jgi:cellulose synthase/poly-beta-1,6-N-acetylglucosamine synthase-like glycosyltransferase